MTKEQWRAEDMIASLQHDLAQALATIDRAQAGLAPLKATNQLGGHGGERCEDGVCRCGLQLLLDALDDHRPAVAYETRIA